MSSNMNAKLWDAETDACIRTLLLSDEKRILSHNEGESSEDDEEDEDYGRAEILLTAATSADSAHVITVSERHVEIWDAPRWSIGKWATRFHESRRAAEP